MQVTEISNEGLRREYVVLIPKGDIEERMNDRLSSRSNRKRARLSAGQGAISYPQKAFWRCGARRNTRTND